MNKTRLQFFLILTSFITVSCATTPPVIEKTPSYYLTNTQDTKIANWLSQHTQLQPKQTKVTPLSSGLDALFSRLALISQAEKSIDLQYYIFRSDLTGKLLSWQLWEAANRGVRVRMLIDDLGSAASDQALLALSYHNNIELRLFNPFFNRSIKGLEFLTSFNRVNHRMHNKSLTIDNQVTIVGGRNLGDEYFDADPYLQFGDFDLLAIGSVVSDVSAQFDQYWNNDKAYPIEAISTSSLTSKQMQKNKQAFANEIITIKQSPVAQRLESHPLYDKLEPHRLTWYEGNTQLLYDGPDKTSNSTGSSLMINDIIKAFDQAKKSIFIVSPYFIPGDAGVKKLAEYSSKGISVSILTNSLAATDVVAVHGGYKSYRKALLEAGIRLFESKVNPANKPSSWSGSSRVSLHAKTFTIDEDKVFVGSFNFDPRSVLINTEMGLIIHSKPLSTRVYNGSSALIKNNAYELKLSEQGDIEWHGPNKKVYHSEPDASIWRKLGAILTSWLPIEEQL